MSEINKLVDAFLSWKLPDSVCSDGCVTTRNYPGYRSGTNLLTADEARLMFEHVLPEYETLKKKNAALATALADAISTYGPKDEILVTEERQEAWKRALDA